MQCDESRTKLSGLVDDELDAEAVIAVERHLAACSACAAELARIQDARGLLRERRGIEAPADLWQRIEARRELARRVPFYAMAARAAAAFLLGFGLFVTAWALGLGRTSARQPDAIKVLDRAARTLRGPGSDQFTSRPELELLVTIAQQGEPR